jgi:DHA1 family solute carrier family 18 vesicular amine transporter 1/2
LFCRILVGPPTAGALYGRWGFRGPFIFGIIITCVDLVARLLIIERKDAIVWGIDPAALVANPAEDDSHTDPELIAARPATAEVENQPSQMEKSDQMSPRPAAPAVASYTPLGLLWRLLRSSRAMICIFNTLIYGRVLLHVLLRFS